jgi:alkanesulfonate monooxygenase SsuD/methylene tetrahydromethanopterin reductase-like flavin-dependent oxidoreductase (luciferase family)
VSAGIGGWASGRACEQDTGVLSYAIGLPNVREYADPAVLVELAVEAEAAGWDGAFLWDHIAREEDPSVPATDPWIAVAAIAARTSRLRLGILVTPLARRRPWKVAREAVAVDALSGGRFTLGVGLGGGANAEFAAFGEDPDPRARADRLDEGLAILDGLWSGEPFSFSGSYHRVEGAHFVPRAVQEPRIPIWVAGRWPNKRPFRRAARWDGLFPLFDGYGAGEMPPPSLLAEAVAYTRAQREGDGPFDVALENVSAGEDLAADAARAADYERAGLTWWIEALGWFRGPLEAMRERVRRGAPRS